MHRNRGAAVLLCRAAQSGMAAPRSSGVNSPMMRKLIQTDAYSRRLRLSSREIAVAVALTLAALVFLAAALNSNGHDALGRGPLASTDSTKAN
jgi:hypothetical protein